LDATVKARKTDSDIDNNNNSKKRQRRSAVLNPCVLLHNDQGTMRRCNSNINLRPLKQLIGTWEIDGNAIKDKDLDELLGVCESDFLFDMNNLHSENAKQLVDSENSYVHYRICLFCNKLKCFSSRGKYCREHSWQINNRNIQIPCIGNSECKALAEGL